MFRQRAGWLTRLSCLFVFSERLVLARFARRAGDRHSLGAVPVEIVVYCFGGVLLDAGGLP